MIENQAYEPEEGDGGRSRTLPRSKSPSGTKSRSSCNYVAIALGVFGIVALAAAIVVIAIHLQTGSQWRQDIEEKTAANEKLTSDLKKAEETLKSLGGKDIVAAYEDLTAKHAKATEELQSKTSENTKLAENLKEKTAENAQLNSGLQKANEDIADLRNITSALLKQSNNPDMMDKLKQTEDAVIELRKNLTTALDTHSAKTSELSSNLANAKTEITELQKTRTEDAKANGAKFDDLTTMMSSANEKITRHEGMIKDPCPVKYNGSCYWFVARYAGVKLDAGGEICKSAGGKLANVYSEDHHYMLMGLLRIFAGKIGHVNAWIGMTYNKDTKTAHFSDGRVAPFVKWYADHPNPDYCCKMTIHANMDWTSVHQGVHTIPPSGDDYGVICEK